VATFTGPANIQNVISRVTGGTASSIDGTIQCTIPGANFFLINPFGVMFGPSASVNVSGSFAVTTADYVKLADGGRFDARTPVNDVLTAAPVSAFGFLGPTAAPISLQGPSATAGNPVLAQLADDKSFLIIGGDVHIDNFQITVPSGRIALIGIASAGTVGTDVNNVQSSIDTSTFSQLGNIALTTLSTLDVSGNPGGRIDIQSENLLLRDSFLGASSLGIQDGLGISLVARDAITLQGVTSVSTDSSDTGAAGEISMTAKSILMLGEPVTGMGAVNVSTDTFGPGRAGDIDIHTDILVIENGVVVSASTEDTGDGGNISINAKSVLMAGEQSTAVLSTTSFGGTPGNIRIQTDALTLKADAQITAEAFGSSPAGAIQITARQMSIDDSGGVAAGFAGISASSADYGSTSGLRAGDITINLNNLDMRDGAQISSSSGTGSPGGNIIVTATDQIRLADSQITTHAGGDGGNVQLNAPSFVYALGSDITAQSVNGNGGNITIDAPGVALKGTTLDADAVQGNGGNVDITSRFFLQSSGTIEVSSEFGLQGTVTVPAPDTEIAGSLVELTAELLGADTLLSPDCAARLPGGVSSFTVLGRGGVPVEPDALLPAVQRASDSEAP